MKIISTQLPVRPNLGSKVEDLHSGLYKSEDDIYMKFKEQGCLTSRLVCITNTYDYGNCYESEDIFPFDLEKCPVGFNVSITQE